MKVYESAEWACGHVVESAVAIGNFDGVHLGHQALIARLKQTGCSVTILTFDPHPARFLRPSVTIPRLSTVKQKTQLLDREGVECVVIQPFNASFAQLTAEDFVREILVRCLHTKHVAIGEGFRFGNRRAGDAQLLEGLGAVHGFHTHVVSAVRHDGEIVSSSRIRALLSEGDVPRANSLLGRRYSVTGVIKPGAGRGARIGVPTANVKPDNELVPGPGVYAGWASVPGLGLGKARSAVMSIGPAPTFEREESVLEVHLLADSPPDLCGREITVDFEARLRSIERFDTVERLCAAMQKDIAEARTFLAAKSPRCDQ